MYTQESFSDGLVTVTHPTKRYKASFPAADAAAAEQVVVDLNKPALIERLKQARLEYEEAGLFFNNQFIKTTRENQRRILDLNDAVAAGSVELAQIETATGWELISTEDLTTLVNVLRIHINSCDMAESSATQDITGFSTMAELEAFSVIDAIETSLYGGLQLG